MPDQLEVAKRFGVGGYPLLIVFRHGKQYNFTGVRNEDGELVMVVTSTGHIIALNFTIVMYYNTFVMICNTYES